MDEYKQGLQADRERRLGLASDKHKKHKKRSREEKRNRTKDAKVNETRAYYYIQFKYFWGCIMVNSSIICRFRLERCSGNDQKSMAKGANGKLIATGAARTQAAILARAILVKVKMVVWIVEGL